MCSILLCRGNPIFFHRKSTKKLESIIICYNKRGKPHQQIKLKNIKKILKMIWWLIKNIIKSKDILFKTSIFSKCRKLSTKKGRLSIGFKTFVPRFIQEILQIVPSWIFIERLQLDLWWKIQNTPTNNLNSQIFRRLSRLIAASYNVKINFHPKKDFGLLLRKTNGDFYMINLFKKMLWESKNCQKTFKKYDFHWTINFHCYKLI